MISESRFGRRLILRRLAGGGAVFCTLFGESNGNRAISAPAGSSARELAPLIIVDPGHGGRDPGAIGAAGTLEKNVTLASALALKTVLEARGCYRVELTRTEDHFLSKEDRVDLTRELGASLFLSLHADQLSNASVRGASVYTLAKRPSDEETEALADRENRLSPGENRSAGLVAPEVSGILASLSARETRAASSRFAHRMISDLERDLPVVPSPERQANFAVLHTSGIPSVLIEMGFLSNPTDEAALNDPGHRELVARAMTRAVDAWFFPTNVSG